MSSYVIHRHTPSRTIYIYIYIYPWYGVDGRKEEENAPTHYHTQVDTLPGAPPSSVSWNCVK